MLLLLLFLVVVVVVPGCCLLVFVGACWCCCCCLCVCVVCVRVWWGCSRFLGLSPGPHLRRTAFPLDHPKFRSFFSLPPEISFFSPSLGGLLAEFWWCLKAGTLKCARLGSRAAVARGPRRTSKPTEHTSKGVKAGTQVVLGRCWVLSFVLFSMFLILF